MRSHFQQVLTVAVAASIFSAPTALGENSKARLLNFEEARKAFGETFGPEVDGKSLFIFGVSSSKCLVGTEATTDAEGNTIPGKAPALKVSVDGNSGVVEVHYDGSDDSCLDKEKALAEDHQDVSIKDLTATTLTGDFESLVLRSLNYGNDREPNKLEALLNSKNEKIASVSEDTRKRLEKEEAARREALAAEYYDNVLERCLSQGGAVALEESEKALKNLQEIASYMESKEEGWADERLSAINKRRFDAAKAIIEKGRVFGNEKKGSFTLALELIEQVRMNDDSYDAEAKKLYEKALDRLASEKSDPSEVVELAEQFVEHLEALSESEKDDARIAALERNLYVSQMGRVAKLGADHEDFEAMTEKYTAYLEKLDENTGGCLASEEEASPQFGLMNVQQIQNPSCRGIAQLNHHFITQVKTAQMITQQRVAQAQFQAKVNSCMEADQLASSLGQTDANGAPLRSVECNAVMTRLAEIQKAAPSQSSTYLQGNAWGTVYSTQDSRTPAGATTPSAANGTNTTAPANNALSNTGIGAANSQNGFQNISQNIQQNTANPIPQQPVPAQPPVQNTGVRRTFRR